MKYHTSPDLISANVNVSVVGIGGTGAYLMSLLAQMNFILKNISEGQAGLSVTAYDDDTVSEFNVGRQNFWPQDIGNNKAKTIIDRLNTGFGTTWNCVEQRYPHNDTYRRTDVIMTCVDNIKSRIEIGKKAKGRKTECLWIDGGNDLNSGNVIFGHLGTPKSSMKIPNWYDLYYETMKNIKDTSEDSCSHIDAISKQDFGVNHQTALLMAQTLWKILRYGETSIGAQYFDIKEGETSSLTIDPKVWESFGYTEHLQAN